MTERDSDNPELADGATMVSDGGEIWQAAPAPAVPPPGDEEPPAPNSTDDPSRSSINRRRAARTSAPPSSEVARNATTLHGETDSSVVHPPTAARPVPPDIGRTRYTFLDLIARGGQGEVWQVHDHTLGRDLALKILRTRSTRRSRRRFEFEIALTVALSHPGIVPVFDRGIAKDGRPWFAMKRVEGRHLGEEIRAVFAGHGGWTLRRLVDLLSRICDAVAYAHQQGVLHRDLKPRNIMVGAFGEVLVMDWGLARELPRGRASTSSRRARARSPAGTTGYIAPESYADPSVRDARIDVFSLGAILYTILCGRRPPTGPQQVPSERDFPRIWADGSALPPDLTSLCLRAMALEPDDRTPSAAAMRRSLVDWLDGARKRDEALDLVRQARGMIGKMDRLRTQVVELRRKAAVALEAVPPFAPAAEKLAGWALEDDARRKSESLAMEELTFEQKLGAALTRVPGLPEAHGLLADHYKARLIDAEARRDSQAAKRAEALLVAHDRGQHAEWLAGDGRLTLITAPSGARVTVHPFVEVERRLVPGEGVSWGTTPVIDRALPRGSYLVMLEADGCEPVRYPVFMERGGRWDCVPPGATEAQPIALPAVGELGPDDVYVPAGWAWLGGDELASSALPRCRVWIDAFVIRRFSVTHREWMVFLDDLEERGDRALYARCVPRHRDGSPSYVRRPDGTTAVIDDYNERVVDLDEPVVLVDWHSAVEYTRWLSRQSGAPWRLPHDLEWEKAARGVDGRFLPWGDHPEPSWSRTLDSFSGPAQPVRIGERASDVSVYGARDMAGTVRNWCNSAFDREARSGRLDVGAQVPSGESRVVRGGAWPSKISFCRPAGRFTSLIDQRFRVIGIRLARSIG